jgi:hypothetical protein
MVRLIIIKPSIGLRESFKKPIEALVTFVLIFIAGILLLIPLYMALSSLQRGDLEGFLIAFQFFLILILLGVGKFYALVVTERQFRRLLAIFLASLSLMILLLSFSAIFGKLNVWIGWSGVFLMIYGVIYLRKDMLRGFRKLEELANSIIIKGDKIEFKNANAREGVVVVYKVYNSSMSTYETYVEFFPVKAHGYILLSPEVFLAPAYKLNETIVAVLKPMDSKFKGSLSIESTKGDLAKVEFEIKENILKGFLKFEKVHAKRARLELIGELDFKYRKKFRISKSKKVKIAEIDGERVDFVYPLSCKELTVLIFHERFIDVQDVAESLNLNTSIVFGNIGNYKLRLILEPPKLIKETVLPTNLKGLT